MFRIKRLKIFREVKPVISEMDRLYLLQMGFGKRETNDELMQEDNKEDYIEKSKVKIRK